jgi:hypothetical protein
VFVVSDSNQAFYESDTADSTAYASTPLEVQLPPPCNLVAGTVTIPADAVPGQDMTVSYQVSNAGPAAADGNWYDAIYLSPTPAFSPSDPLLGRVYESRDVATSGSYSDSLTAPLPGVAPGQYYVILRSNITDAIPETTLADNLSASLTQTSLSVPALTLGTPARGSLATGDSAYYQVTVAAGQTLQVSLTDPLSSDANELYLAFGSMPTRSQYDYRYNQPFQANQTITVPATQAGTYYLLAYNGSGSGTASYSLEAAYVPFAVTAVEPGTVGNAGNATIEIEGGQFDRATTFQLVGPGNTIIHAAATTIQDSATAYATFDLQGAATVPITWSPRRVAARRLRSRPGSTCKRARAVS